MTMIFDVPVVDLSAVIAPAVDISAIYALSRDVRTREARASEA